MTPLKITMGRWHLDFSVLFGRRFIYACSAYEIYFNLIIGFRPKPLSSNSKESWRTICCIPYIYVYMFVVLLSLAATILVVISAKHTTLEPFGNVSSTISPRAIIDNLRDQDVDDKDEDDDDVANLESTFETTSNLRESICKVDDLICLEKWEENIILFIVLSILVFVGLIMVANISTFWRCLKSLIFSQRKHLQRTIAKLDLVKSEGYLQAVKNEVQLMVSMIKAIDAFTGLQTRLVVIVGENEC